MLSSLLKHPAVEPHDIPKRLAGPKILSCKKVPQDAELYFWDGESWLEWEEDTVLPGPPLDPLHVKVVHSQPAGNLCHHLSGNHHPAWLEGQRYDALCPTLSGKAFRSMDST